MQDKHIIKRQVIEIAAKDASTRDRWLESWRALSGQKILLVIDEVCSAIAPSGSLYRIDRLEVDLGHVDLEDLASPVIVDRLRDHLYQAFIQTQGVMIFAPTATILDAQQEKDNLKPPSEDGSHILKQAPSGTSLPADKSGAGTSVEELFLHLIRTGLLPWWAEEEYVQNTPKQIKALPEVKRVRFWKDVSPLLQQEIYRKRLIMLFSDEELISILSTWKPLIGLIPAVQEYLTIHVLLAQHFGMPAPIVRHVVWEALLSAMSLNIPMPSETAALHLHIVSAIAGRTGQPITAVISGIGVASAGQGSTPAILPDWFASFRPDAEPDSAISQMPDSQRNTPTPESEKQSAAIKQDALSENASIEPTEKKMESPDEQADFGSGQPTDHIEDAEHSFDVSKEKYLNQPGKDADSSVSGTSVDMESKTPGKQPESSPEAESTFQPKGIDPLSEETRTLVEKKAALKQDALSENASIEPTEKKMESPDKQADFGSGQPTSHIEDAEHSIGVSKEKHLNQPGKEAGSSVSGKSVDMESKTPGKQPESSHEVESTVPQKGIDPLSEETRTLVEKKAALWNRRFSQSEEIYVNNAGLVILAPYLIRFFNNLEWLKEKEFINTDLQQRALVLLQYLADGTTDAPEYRLPLNKLLSGWPLEAPLDPQEPLNEEEQAAAEVLLTAVIGHAPVLRDMSPESFRNTFLRREGVLKYNDPYWLLRVKRETYDIVLDQFPWSFNIIKLPWMATALYVEW